MQLRRHVTGTQWDDDLAKRPQNVAHQQEQVRIGVKERAKAQVHSAIPQNPRQTGQVTAIAKQPLTPAVANYAHGIQGNFVGTADDEDIRPKRTDAPNSESPADRGWLLSPTNILGTHVIAYVVTYNKHFFCMYIYIYIL